MPYFKNNDINILFIHIPKTGGTSIEHYFSYKYGINLNNKSLFSFLDKKVILDNKLNDINSSLQHITYNTIYKYNYFFNINLNDIQILTIVRNPYERILSDLFFFGKISIYSSSNDVFNVIKKYLKDDNLDNHNIPQYIFITNNKRELIPNIIILHCESLTDDMIKLGYTDFNKNINVNQIKKNLNYKDYLNNDSIKLINDFYNYDFILFNYSKI